MSRFERGFHVSWDQIHRDAKALAWRLMDVPTPTGGWKGIIAVTRGGMVPACIVARELDLRTVDCVAVASYEETAQGAVQLLKPVHDGVGDGTGWIVVDDLVDTGGTFVALRRLMPRAHFAVVYAKPRGEPACDTHITQVSQDTWVYFPWDMDMRPVEPAAKQAHWQGR